MNIFGFIKASCNGIIFVFSNSKLCFYIDATTDLGNWLNGKMVLYLV
jgi:hypothetical protein